MTVEIIMGEYEAQVNETLSEFETEDFDQNGGDDIVEYRKHGQDKNMCNHKF